MSVQQHALAALYRRERPGTHFTGTMLASLLYKGNIFPSQSLKLPFEPNSVMMKMEAAHSAETSGQIYYLVWCKSPEDYQLSSEIL